MGGATGAVARSFQTRLDALEEATLSPLAARAAGAPRLQDERAQECSLRTPFQRDRDRIVHCKAFRRLRGKTQVFIAPEGDHYRTRLSHTLEVCGISRTVARALRLNEDLTEVIALGHDLGHPPFGHGGEAALDEALKRHGGEGFRHNEQSLHVVDAVEREGRGLNLTLAARDGILNHTGPVAPQTLEGRIVKLVDRVAYINHDIDDAMRAGVIDPGQLPAGPIELLGVTAAQRIDTLVHDLVETSELAADIAQTAEMANAMLELRSFLFDAVYLRPATSSERRRVGHVVNALVDWLVEHEHDVPPGEGTQLARLTDHVAGMTDRFALRYYRTIFEPSGWRE